MNGMEYCGMDDWTDKETRVIQYPNLCDGLVLYDLFAVNEREKILYTGDTNSGNGHADDKRPTRLELSVALSLR